MEKKLLRSAIIRLVLVEKHAFSTFQYKQVECETGSGCFFSVLNQSMENEILFLVPITVIYLRRRSRDNKKNKLCTIQHSYFLTISATFVRTHAVQIMASISEIIVGLSAHSKVVNSQEKMN